MTTTAAASHLEFVSAAVRQVLGEAGSIPEYVYFPTAGIVSMLYEMKNGTSVEAAVTGHDGIVGVTVFMGGGATTNRAVVRNSGHGFRMRADILKREFEESPSLRQPLLRYTQALLIQMAQSGICHGHHQLVEQFCRLLLSSMDRPLVERVALTRTTIANLLGVRRESITAAAGKLQAAGSSSTAADASRCSTRGARGARVRVLLARSRRSSIGSFRAGCRLRWCAPRCGGRSRAGRRTGRHLHMRPQRLAHHGARRPRRPRRLMSSAYSRRGAFSRPRRLSFRRLFPSRPGR
jgi:CRP-like cAMP-binding protein